MARRIIDVHNHPNWHGHTTDRLVRNMDEHGIEKTWLLSWEIPDDEYNVEPGYHEVMDPRGRGAEFWMIVEGLQKYPNRFIGGWAPDPRSRSARARLQAAVNLYGIKVYGELKLRMRYDNPDAIAMYRFCGGIKLPVLFHLELPRCAMDRLCEDHRQWPAWYGGDITVVDNMCRQCPETIFIGHGPGFWREISADAEADQSSYPSGPVQAPGRMTELLRRHPNLYADLSAGSGANSLERDLDHGRQFVLEFQDRILFGRDYFDRRQLDVLEKLDLPDPVMDKVLCQNALRLIG